VRGTAWLAALAFCLAGCDETGSTGPNPGTLEVRLASPYADDAALVVEVTGPDVQAVTVDSNVYLHAVESATGVTVVLVGDFDVDPLVRLTVPDVRLADEYSATVLQAADRSNALRESVAEYTLTVVEVD
jgi:hypothetical protein